MAIDISNFSAYRVPTDAATAREHIAHLKGDADFVAKLHAGDSTAKEIWRQLNVAAASQGASHTERFGATITEEQHAAGVAKIDALKNDKSFVERLHSADPEVSGPAKEEWDAAHREAYSGWTNFDAALHQSNIDTDKLRYVPISKQKGEFEK